MLFMELMHMSTKLHPIPLSEPTPLVAFLYTVHSSNSNLHRRLLTSASVRCAVYYQPVMISLKLLVLLLLGLLRTLVPFSGFCPTIPLSITRSLCFVLLRKFDGPSLVCSRLRLWLAVSSGPRSLVWFAMPLFHSISSRACSLDHLLTLLPELSHAGPWV